MSAYAVVVPGACAPGGPSLDTFLSYQNNNNNNIMLNNWTRKVIITVYSCMILYGFYQWYKYHTEHNI